MPATETSSRRPSLLRLLRLFLIAFAVFMVGPAASTASAIDWDWRKVDILPSFIDGDGLSTGADCTSPPNPQRADAGVYGWLDPGKTTSRILIPEKDREKINVDLGRFGTFEMKGPATKNPFKNDADVSIYEVYGYSGLTVHQYDRGDVKGCLPSWNPAVQASNLMAWVQKTGQALTIRLYGFVFGGLSFLQTFQNFSAQVTGYALLLPLLSIAVMFTGFYFMLRARRGDVAEATGKSINTGAIIALGLAAALYPIAIGGAVDKGMAGVLSATGDQISSQRGEKGQTPPDAATAVASNMHESILWPAWKDSWFGREHTQTANKYGPALFSSMAFTRYETDLVKKDPSKAGPIINGKQRTFKAVAEQVKKEDPGAYQYLAGKQTGDQAGTWFVSLIGTLFALGPFLYALCRFLYAMVLTRVGIAIAPAVALVTQHPKYQAKALEMGKYIGMAIVAACAFGAYSMIYVVAGVGTILSPQNGWHPIFKMLILALMNYAAWRLAKRFGLVDQRGVRERFKERRKTRKNRRDRRRNDRQATPEPTLDPRPRPGPADPGPAPGDPIYMPQTTPQNTPTYRPAIEPPRESGLGTRVIKSAGKGAAQGATATAAAGVATGGTVTAGAVVVGGLKGAALELFRPKRRSGGGGPTRTRKRRSAEKSTTSVIHRPQVINNQTYQRVKGATGTGKTRTTADSPRRVLTPTAIYTPIDRTPSQTQTRRARRRRDDGTERVYDVYVPSKEDSKA